jgi:hypothetical protein
MDICTSGSGVEEHLMREFKEKVSILTYWKQALLEKSVNK